MPLFGTPNGGSLFSRIKSGASNLFSGIRSGASAVTNAANKASSILGTIGDIAKNPIVQTIAGGLGQGDNLNKFVNATSQGANIAQRVGGIGSKVVDATSPGTYFGQPAVPAVRNAVERAKGIVGDTKSLFDGFLGHPLGGPGTYSPFNSAGVRVR